MIRRAHYPWPFPASVALRPAASPAPAAQVDMEPVDDVVRRCEDGCNGCEDCTDYGTAGEEKAS